MLNIFFWSARIVTPGELTASFRRRKPINRQLILADVSLSKRRRSGLLASGRRLIVSWLGSLEGEKIKDNFKSPGIKVCAHRSVRFYFVATSKP